MFGFVTVRHVVKFTDQTEYIYTENVIGQKINVIYAPIVEGESKEDQERRRLSLLATFDHRFNDGQGWGWIYYRSPDEGIYQLQGPLSS